MNRLRPTMARRAAPVAVTVAGLLLLAAGQRAERAPAAASALRTTGWSRAAPDREDDPGGGTGQRADRRSGSARATTSPPTSRVTRLRPTLPSASAPRPAPTDTVALPAGPTTTQAPWALPTVTGARNPITNGPGGSPSSPVLSTTPLPTTPLPTTPLPTTPLPTTPPPTTPLPTTMAPVYSAPSTTASALSVSRAWTLGQRPFVASSSWNTPLPATARYTDLRLPAATGNNYWVDWEAYSIGVYHSQPTDPRVLVKHPSGWGHPAGYVILHLPAGVTGAAGSDASIVVIDGTIAYNMWQFTRVTEATATAAALAWADAVTGTGWGTTTPLRGAGITGAGSNQLAGLLVQAETDAGEIGHALEVSVDSTLNGPGMTGEAIHFDGQSPTGRIYEGQRLAIPRSTPMPPGLSPLGQKVFRAFQTYGAFDVDSSGGSTTLRAQSNAYDQGTITALRADMQLMGPLLQAVTV